MLQINTEPLLDEMFEIHTYAIALVFILKNCIDGNVSEFNYLDFEEYLNDVCDPREITEILVDFQCSQIVSSVEFYGEYQVRIRFDEDFLGKGVDNGREKNVCKNNN